MTDEWRPAFAGQRPPFPPGNLAALKHGAVSRRLIDEAAGELLADLRATGDLPWLADIDVVALESWAVALATCRRLRSWIEEHGDFDEAGKPVHAHDLLTKWERRLDRAQKALGFDPLARAALGKDTAIAQAMASHAVDSAQRVGRELRLRALGDDDDDVGASDVWLLAGIVVGMLYAVAALAVLIGRVS